MVVLVAEDDLKSYQVLKCNADGSLLGSRLVEVKRTELNGEEITVPKDCKMTSNKNWQIMINVKMHIPLTLRWKIDLIFH